MIRKLPQPSTGFLVTLGLLALLVKLWLVQAHALIGLVSPHDCQLFLNLAHHLLSGDWFGKYNQLTLIKGPFYPLFIAANYWLGLPLLVSQQLLYGLACLVVIRALSAIVRHPWLLLLFFLFLLFNPFTFNYPTTAYMYRLGIYPALGLLVFGALLGVLIRAHTSKKNALLWAIGLGLALSAFWHTREEGIWIIPSLLLVVLVNLFSLRTAPKSDQFKNVLIHAVPFLIWVGTTFLLCTINQNQYGVFTTVELKHPAFKSAYGGLLHIKSKHWRQFFPVDKTVREQAYQVSPTFKELQPYLEGPMSQRWMKMTGQDDVGSAHFVWAFRDAVALAGYYKNGPETIDFYKRMGEEIEAGCATGKLECLPGVSPLLPPWTSAYNVQFFPTYFSVIKRIVSFDTFTASTGKVRSKGDSSLMILYKTVTRQQLLTSRKKIHRAIPNYDTELNRTKTEILNGIGRVYQTITPILFLLALAALLISLIRTRLTRMNLFCLSVLGGLLANALILTMLSITCYSLIGRPMHTTYPVVLLFIVSSWSTILFQQKGHHFT